MRRLLCLAAACAPALLPSPAAAQDDDVLARVDRPTPVAAYGGRVAWSVRDPATDRFTLVSQTSGGTPAPLPVAPRGVPFDVDLGPGPDGGVTAVYSRCRTEPPNFVQMVRGRGCDVYAFDFAAGTERRVAAVSSPSASEAWPTHPPRSGSPSRASTTTSATTRTSTSTPASGSDRMPGGQRNTCSRGRCTDNRRSEPFELELYGRRLAFSWRYTDFAEGFAYDLRLDDVQASRRRPAPRRPRGRRRAELGPARLAGLRGRPPVLVAVVLRRPGRLHRPPRALPLALHRRHRPGPRIRRAASSGAHDRDGGATYLVRDTFGGGGTECRGDPDVPGGTCEVVRAVPAFG